MASQSFAPFAEKMVKDLEKHIKMIIFVVHL